LYKWDGKFAANESVLGSWKQVGMADSITQYKPGAKLRVGPTPGQLTLLANGKTSDPLFYYTGDVLMDLDKNQALKMHVQTIGKEDLLVIERTGGDQNQAPVTVYRKAPASK
jgi:hypothetical protein